MTVAHDSSNGVDAGDHALKTYSSHADDFGTLAIHAGSEPSSETGAVIPPLSLSTTYKQDGVGNHKGFEYSRGGNPNRQALETTLAALEAGGAYAIAFSSGMAAVATLMQTAGQNAHLVSVNDIYGGTFRYLKRVATETQGVETTFVDFEKDDRTILAAFRRNTKLVWIESPTNPTLRIVDIPRIVSLARSHPSRPLVVVDNTFMSPFYQSPLLLGADVVVHSLSKYVNGHSDVIMGGLILPAHHAPLLQKLRLHQKSYGAVPSPHDCWMVQRGAKTLHLRMKAHGINALRLAQMLERSPWVENVIYPGLPSHPRKAIVYRQLSPHARRFVDTLPDECEDQGGFPCGGVLSFRIRGGAAEANAFVTETRLFVLAESLGGVESLVGLPAQMTHASLSEADRAALGIGPNLIRLSAGVEETADLVKDVEQALEAAVSGVKREPVHVPSSSDSSPSPLPSILDKLPPTNRTTQPLSWWEVFLVTLSHWYALIMRCFC